MIGLCVIGGIVWYVISSPRSQNGNTNTSSPNTGDANPIGVVPVVTQPADTDRDGLTDEEETAANSNPELSDTDDDGLADLAEVKTYQTDPRLSDTDGDGIKDGEEVRQGYDPKGPGRLLDVGQAIQGLNTQTE